MDTESSATSSAISRRELLARGAKIGAVAWVVPTVTVLSLDRSAAAAASGGGTPHRPRPPRRH